MYILTKLEYSVLKSIHDHLSSRGRDPILNPVHMDELDSPLQPHQLKAAIHAMVEFSFVSLLGERVVLTPMGHKVFKDARQIGDMQCCTSD